MTLPAPDRRDFLAGVAAGLAGLAVTACAGPLHASAAGPDVAPRSATAWDDSWTERLGRLRTVFDVSDLDSGSSIETVPDVMDAYHAALGTTDRDLGIVLVLRHRAVPFFFADAIWAKYDIAQKMAEKDPVTKAPFKVNPQRELVARLQQRGVIVLGCDRAVSGFIGRVATQAKANGDDVRREVRAGIMPGVILQPNGLYALSRAQTVGCGFMR